MQAKAAGENPIRGLDGLDRPLPPGDARRRPSPEAERVLRSPRRRQAATFDPALNALLAARARKLPVWWEANTRDEIHRALDLADEFGTTAVIVGGREAAKVVDRLKAAKVPVVLRLNFPEEPRVPTEAGISQAADLAERDEPLRVLAQARRSGRNNWRPRPRWPRRGCRSPSRPRASSGSIRSRQLRQLITAGLTADDALAGATRERGRDRGRRQAAGNARTGQARPRDRHDRPLQRREGQGQVRADRRPEVRDQARGPAPDDTSRRRRPGRLASGGEPATPRPAREDEAARGSSDAEDDADAASSRTPSAPASAARGGSRPTGGRRQASRAKAAPRRRSTGPDERPKRPESQPRHRRKRRSQSGRSPRPSKKPIRSRAGRTRGKTARQRRRPLSTSRPNSTRIASRRSRPAATSSSRGRRS